ncbi:MAG: hypothetical protein J6U54_05460 [Clostridiales bacterium]|nr:hypothetical protein [Clostridiales bacterium]
MADFRITRATSDDYIDFVPLDAEFSIDTDSDNESLGVGLGSEDLLLSFGFKDESNTNIGFSESELSDMGIGIEEDSQRMTMKITDFVQRNEGGLMPADYSLLENKPSINGVVLNGDLDGFAYGLQNRIVPGQGLSMRSDGVTLDVDVGLNIQSISAFYGVSDTVQQYPSTWYNYIPAARNGQYLWIKTVTTYLDPEIPDAVTYTYSKQGEDGTDGTNGEDGVVLRIDSSRGNVFKHNQVSTVLTITIHSGPDIITNIQDLRSKFGNNAYLQWYWRRMEDDAYGIIVQTDSRISDDGFSFTLSPEDVDVKVTFMCQLVI